MKKTAFIYHPDFELHDTGRFHPEQPARTPTIYRHIKDSSIAQNLIWITPEPADPGIVALNHDPEYIDFVQRRCKEGAVMLDSGDTRVCEDSYHIALLSVGGALSGVDAVMRGEADNAFCCIRPPGHHALYDEAMGFCVFNNVAIAANYARRQYGLERILIIDWDVHHGNGTQASFYEDPGIFFFSIHQYPFYPGSGSAEETGRGNGLGYTLNVPLAMGASVEKFRSAFINQLRPAAEAFEPQLILLSAGFDAHADDPLASLLLSDVDFINLAGIVKAMSDDLCEGRLVALLEGGYNLSALARSVEGVVRVMMS